MALRLPKHVRVALAALALTGMAMPAAGQVQQGHFVVKDARNIEADAVRFAASQGTEAMPNIVLLGGGKDVWPKIRGAVAEAEAAGYPVRAILVGPTNETPALEIYAKGWKVTHPINPNEVRSAVLVRLIREVHREYYERS